MTFVNWPDKDLRPIADSVSFGTNKIGSDLQRNRKKSVPNRSASVWPDADIWTRSLSSWWFYNRQEEVLDQKSPKVIDRFVFNYLAFDNAGETADNKHSGSMIFRFFLLASKTDKLLGNNAFQNQSIKLICWQAFSFIRFFHCFSLFSFEAEIDAF